MKRILFLLLTVLFTSVALVSSKAVPSLARSTNNKLCRTSSGTSSGVEMGREMEGKTVYVCGNGTTKVYHLKETCQGMTAEGSTEGKRCTYETLKMTQDEAKKNPSTALRAAGVEALWV